MKNKLEKRMYYLTMYNISDIQKSIQALHATVEYSLKYWKTKEFWRWAKKHKTVILLNGGTSNDGIKSIYGEPKSKGTMENHLDTLKENKIKCAAFKEPDLNGSMTSIAFLVDERVFNKKDYPDFTYTYEDHAEEARKGYLNEVLDDYQEIKSIKFNNYSKKVGKDISFLKEFLKQFRLA